MTTEFTNDDLMTEFANSESQYMVDDVVQPEDKLVATDNVITSHLNTGTPLREMSPEVSAIAGESVVASRTETLQQGVGEAERIAFNDPTGINTETLGFYEKVNAFITEESAKPSAQEFTIEMEQKGFPENYETEFYERTVYQMFERAGMFETGVNWASLLLLPDYLKDLADYTGTSVLDAPAAMQRMVEQWRSLPRDQRIQAWSQIQKDVLAAADENEVKASIILMSYLDPTAEEETDFNALLGGVDWGLLALPVVAKIAGIARRVSSLRRIAKLGSNEKAAQVTATNIQDTTEATAAAISRPREVSAMDAHPANWEAIDAQSVDGLAGATDEIRELVEEQVSGINVAARDVVEDDYVRLNLLDEDEAKKFIESKAVSYQQYLVNKYKETGYRIDSMELVDQTHDGFKFKVNMRNTDPSVPNSVKEEMSSVIAFDKSGIILKDSELSAAPVSSFLLSPEIWMKKAFSREGVVDDATLIGFQQQRLASKLKDAHLAVWKGSSKEERGRLGAILQAGADRLVGKDRGTVFSYEELVLGVATPTHGVVKLNPKEIARYYSARHLFDINHMLLNNMQRQTLTKNGFREWKIGNKDFAGIPYHTPDSIPSSSRAVSEVWDFETQALVKHNAKTIKKKYEDGYELIKLHDSSYIAGKHKSYSHAWVRRNSDKELRHDVINKVRGYVPRIYKDTPYTLYKTVKKQVDNGFATSRKAIRLFQSRAEAEAYKARRMEKVQARGKTNTSYEVQHYTQGDMAQNADAVIAEAGGLFVDPKGRHLGMGLKGDKAPTVDPIQALQRQLSFLSFNIPMNEWRISMAQRWVNNAKPYMRASDAANNNFNAVLQPIANQDVRLALEKSRNFIRDQLLVPTPSEKMWAHRIMKIADWVDGKPVVGGASNSLHNLAGKDPYSAIRATTFHTLLGALNPAQIWVQAQGASIALSLDPTGAPDSLRKWLGIRTAFHHQNNPTIVKAAAKAAGMKESEFRHMLRDFDRTGLPHSIRTNADMEAMKYGFHMDDTAIKRVLNSGLYFYQEGEMFTRTFAFLTARRAMLKKRGLKSIDRPFTNAEMIDVTERTTKKMLNLQRANRAGWQKGVLSIPTQFQQITAKYYEALLGKKFTGAERFKILAGQLVLYGSAGVAFGQWVAENAAVAVGEDPTTLSDATKAAVRDGFWGLVTELATGEGFALGKRGAAASGLEQALRDYFTGRIGALEAMSGASGHIGQGLYRFLSETAPLVTTPDTDVFTLDNMEIVANKLGSLVKTYDQMHQAYLWDKAGAILNRRGQAIVSADRVDNFRALVWGKRFGITSEAQISASDDMLHLRSNQKIRADVLKNMRRVYDEFVSSSRDEAAIRNFRSLIHGLVSPYDEDIQYELREQFWKGVFDETTPEDRRIKQLIDTLTSNASQVNSPLWGGKGMVFSTSIKPPEETD